MKKYSTIFIGTSEFSLPSLEKLIQTDFIDLKLVITQPDKPVGRKKIITPPPVKVLAEKNHLSILQPIKIKDCLNEIKNIKPDLIVLVSYGQIIPQTILDIPKFGCLNIHPSLLPKYRGASPIQTAILNNEKQTGVTLMLMDAQMDHGPILSQKKYQVLESDNYLILSDKLANLGAELLIETLPNYLENKIQPQSQNHSQATYTQILTKQDGQIDWCNSAQQVHQQVKALNPWPGTWTKWNESTLKILTTEITPDQFSTPGLIFKKNSYLCVACQKNSLIVHQIQLEGKKSNSGSAFLAGHQDILNQQFERG